MFKFRGNFNFNTIIKSTKDSYMSDLIDGKRKKIVKNITYDKNSIIIGRDVQQGNLVYVNTENAEKILVIGATRCLSEDTLLDTDKGNIEIGKLKEGQWFNVKTLTEKGIEYKPAFKVKDTETELYELELYSGQKVKCSAEHKFFIKKNDKIIEKKLKYLQVDDVILEESDIELKNSKLSRCCWCKKIIFRYRKKLAKNPVCSRRCNTKYRNKHEKLNEKALKKSIEYYKENVKGKTYEELFGEEEAQRRKKLLSDNGKIRFKNYNPMWDSKVREKIKKIMKKKCANKKPEELFGGKRYDVHPRGMLGKKHSIENKIKISKYNIYREKTKMLCPICLSIFSTNIKLNKENNLVSVEQRYCSSKCSSKCNRYSDKSYTSIEFIFKEFLEKYNIDYIFHDFIHNIPDKYICDFYLPNHNIVVECDCSYWHEKEGRKEQDYNRTIQMKNCGYNVVRFSEKEMTEEIFLKKIGGLIGI